ncbi:hypothetical protein ACWC9X_23710 [Streptomyces asoensis]|nr:hypothetical protein [Streptomyces sp. MBT97]MBK3638330.1 hypothetical protein [Streptomyces sp. MBT97]
MERTDQRNMTPAGLSRTAGPTGPGALGLRRSSPACCRPFAWRATTA